MTPSAVAISEQTLKLMRLGIMSGTKTAAQTENAANETCRRKCHEN